MLNTIVKDSDFGLENKKFSNPRIRLGARGIIVDETGCIAIFNKQSKNEFKLPGGGIDNEENAKDAFVREVSEEAGCIINDIETIGIIEEWESYENFKQKSYVFTAKVVSKTEKTNLTDKEKEEGAILHWLKPNEALKIMETCINNLRDSIYDNIYRSKFMVKRDIEILKYYIKHTNKKE